MNKLDNPKLYRKLDSKNVAGSVAELGTQCEEAWAVARRVKLPRDYRQVDRICVNGMGGSALGAGIIKALYASQLRVPLEVINSYDIPAYVDRRTLYIISSYSGTTEEPVGTRQEALRRQAKVICIAAGGTLARWAQQHQLPLYRINDRVGNPSRQPRLGLGYSLVGQLAMLSKLSLLRVPAADIAAAAMMLRRLNRQWGAAVPQPRNAAKQLAAELLNKNVAIVAAEHLAGNAHVWANQANETAKTLSSYRIIPELNHHLLEGLRFPVGNRLLVRFLFLESKLYRPENQRRVRITQRVVAGNKLSYSRYRLVSRTPLLQACEALALSSYVTLYQGLLSNVDPVKIPWVDYFKSQLKKS